MINYRFIGGDEHNTFLLTDVDGYCRQPGFDCDPDFGFGNGCFDVCDYGQYNDDNQGDSCSYCHDCPENSITLYQGTTRLEDCCKFAADLFEITPTHISSYIFILA